MMRVLPVAALVLLTACGSEPSLPPINPVSLSLPGHILSTPQSGWQLIATLEDGPAVGVGHADDKGDFTLEMDEIALLLAAQPYQRRPDFGDSCTWTGEQDTTQVRVTRGVNIRASRTDGAHWMSPLRPKPHRGDYDWDLFYATGQGRVTAVQTCRSSFDTFDSLTNVRINLTFTPGWNLVEYHKTPMQSTAPGGRELQSSELWIRSVALPGRFVAYDQSVFFGD
ncbi:hypothetical protein [Deinococcus soli (ex Cha et al. 2016)]|uniref:Lipoprotein n=2 Tax=Deinococcus soli (ex Cha et al. 2016) TaxID=1309411 RepID=A0AAE3XD90_9DEIO|nr:hypothetical protein [Deinococcus soli (ex Cha et al. 2016)]MDR6218768.1 hypothetical protein [Deinococcus soli (ex Cha et al. 2016)]MDR6328565.1 hypothetical protein [Deinococcus soli (ex Cha et al. 2016)]MDR6751948.1 hypothetical protein [Deinococcus soli (ex Cha et al. 2016)]